MGYGVLLLVSLVMCASVIVCAARFGAPSVQPSAEALTNRAAREAPCFRPGQILHGNDGAVVAIERDGRHLAMLLPYGANTVFWLVPARRARVEAARPPVLAVATGDFTRPWVRVPLPEGKAGTDVLRLLSHAA
jgi:hypothetical protein